MLNKTSKLNNAKIQIDEYIQIDFKIDKSKLFSKLLNKSNKFFFYLNLFEKNFNNKQIIKQSNKFN